MEAKGNGGIEQPTVFEALSAVMGDVQSVSKTQRNTQQGYLFRGIDAVVNAVGPALRKHGVIVVPTAVSYETERYETKRGAEMRGVTATVSFRFYGPAGDWIDAQALGESSDAGDKAIPKAHSVAYRTLLLQALCIPTDEPDPDLEAHERKAQPKRRAQPKPNVTDTQPDAEGRDTQADAAGEPAAAEVARQEQLAEAERLLRGLFASRVDEDGRDMLAVAVERLAAKYTVSMFDPERENWVADTLVLLSEPQLAEALGILHQAAGEGVAA